MVGIFLVGLSFFVFIFVINIAFKNGCNAYHCSLHYRLVTFHSIVYSYILTEVMQKKDLKHIRFMHASLTKLFGHP